MKKIIIAALSLGLMATAPVNVQAKTQSVWVLTHFTGNAVKGTDSRYQRTYTYDGHGLLKKSVETMKGDDPITTDYTYDAKGHIKKTTVRSTGSPEISKYKTNNKGLIINGKNMIYNKKGLLVKLVGIGTTTYTYNKKNQMIQSDYKYEKESSTTKYQYDSHGYIVREWMPGSNYQETTKYKYNKNGLISSKTWKSTAITAKSNAPETYQYKKIKVSTRYLDEVKREQDALTGKNGYSLLYIVKC